MRIPKEQSSAEYNPETAFTKLDSFIRSKLTSDSEFAYDQNFLFIDAWTIEM